MTSTLQFYQLAIGAEFEFRGLRFRRTAMSAAEGLGEGPKDHHCGQTFTYEAEVISDGPLMSEAEIGLCKPSGRPWTDYLSPAPRLQS